MVASVACVISEDRFTQGDYNEIVVMLPDI